MQTIMHAIVTMAILSASLLGTPALEPSVAAPAVATFSARSLPMRPSPLPAEAWGWLGLSGVVMLGGMAGVVTVGERGRHHHVQPRTRRIWPAPPLTPGLAPSTLLS
ncbi:MAG: hypothetical protein WCF04_09825 [Candidatus Nanopelagicales bacterium]